MFTPLDKNYPQDRINNILEDSHAYLIVDDLGYKTYPRRIQFSLAETLILDLPRIASNQVPACMIYTSGSTGKPKGAILSHKNLVNFSLWYITARTLQHGENYAVHASFGFDAGAIMGTFPPLLIGATIHVIPEEIKLDLAAINQFFIKHQIRGCFFTTLLAEQFMEEYDSNTLRYLECGGEKLNHFTPRRYQFFNAYGPTECTVYATQYQLTQPLSNIPIGKPIANMACYVVDSHMQLVPVGVVGELLIGGDGVGLGYLNRPEMNTEKFIANPFQSGEENLRGYNAILYKTGDLVRWLDDGNIEYIGRNDFQVKIRGYRIELGEIESLFREIEGINQALVITIEDTNNNKYLCAYYESSRHYEVDFLKKQLAIHLASYMIPDHIIRIDKFPLNVNGKIDRRVLPQPDLSDQAKEYVAPTNKTEELVCQAFIDILGINKIGINDEFFNLGGTSIKAIKLVSKLRSHLNVTITDVFNLKTPANIATMAGATLINNIQKTSRASYYPASYSQERMFITNIITGGGILYNVPLKIKISGIVDHEKLGITLDKLVERHAGLRASFRMENEQVVQQVADQVDYKKEYQLASKGEVNRIFHEFIRPFDLSSAPLFRTKLIKVSNNLHYLLFDFHHIIFDGGSIEVLIRDLVNLYHERILTPITIEYHDYSVWQRGSEGKITLNQQREYWVSRFKAIEVEPLNLPLDYPRTKVIGYTGDNIQYQIEGIALAKLQQFAKANNVSIYSTCLAIYSILFYRYTGQNNIIVGTATNGRHYPEIENLIGMFVNTLPILSALDGDTWVVDFMHSTQKNIIEMLDNQDYQIEDLINTLNLTADLGRNPLFDVLFNFSDFTPDVNGKNAAPHFYQCQQAILETTAKFDLSMDITNYADSLELVLNYRTSLFSRETAETIVSHYIHIMDCIVNSVDLQVKQIDYIPAVEKILLLEKFNATYADYPRQASITCLIDQVVVRHANNTALVFENKQISYADLDVQINQTANYLNRQNIKPGDSVGLYCNKSIDMVVAILAILKVGANFVPISDEYTAERVEYIISNSNITLVFTQDALIGKLRHIQQIICLNLDKINGLIKNCSSEFSTTLPNAKSIAYILYTSGTTGNPKGVMVSHNNVICYINAFIASVDLTDKDCVLQQSSYTFDTFIEELFSGLFLGLKIVLVNKEDVLNLHKLVEICNTNKVTTLNCTPALLDIINNNVAAELKTINKYVAGGEELKSQQFDKLFERADIFNTYGPTETTITLTHHKCTADDLQHKITIGKPINNYKVYILDKDNSLCPVGVSGEICVGGEGVTLGYLGLPEMTARQFLPNPFQTEDEKQLGINARIYKTGDLGRWHRNGNIEYIGRNDFQVKIKGIRIELSEVESRLGAVNGVKSCLVLAMNDKHGGKYLCAYYTADKELSVSTIKNQMEKYLTATMIPDYLIWLEAFPMTICKAPCDHIPIRSWPLFKAREVLHSIVNDITRSPKA